MLFRSFLSQGHSFYRSSRSPTSSSPLKNLYLHHIPLSILIFNFTIHNTMPTLPPPQTLPSLPASTLTTILDLLFEPSPPLHTLALPILQSQTFPTYPALISTIHSMLSALLSTDVSAVSTILCSHPRLGEKKVESEQSRKEQAQLNAAGSGGEIGANAALSA